MNNVKPLTCQSHFYLNPTYGPHDTSRNGIIVSVVPQETNVLWDTNVICHSHFVFPLIFSLWRMDWCDVQELSKRTSTQTNKSWSPSKVSVLKCPQEKSEFVHVVPFVAWFQYGCCWLALFKAPGFIPEGRFLVWKARALNGHETHPWLQTLTPLSGCLGSQTAHF